MWSQVEPCQVGSHGFPCQGARSIVERAAARGGRAKGPPRPIASRCVARVVLAFRLDSEKQSMKVCTKGLPYQLRANVPCLMNSTHARMAARYKQPVQLRLISTSHLGIFFSSRGPGGPRRRAPARDGGPSRGRPNDTCHSATLHHAQLSHARQGSW